MLFGALLAVAGEANNSETVASMAMAGSVLGMGVGVQLGRSKGFSRRRWALMDLGGVAGTLAGAGLGVLGDADEGTATLAVLGGLAGLVAAGYAGAEDDAIEVGGGPRIRPTVLPLRDPSDPNAFGLGAGLVVERW